jgi:hypothetical protein
MPDPMMAPQRSPFSFEKSRPESATDLDASTHPVVHERVHAAGFLGRNVGGDIEALHFTRERAWQKGVASMRVIGLIPLLPARIAAHAVTMSLPTGETIPSPVTTTRRLDTLSSLN